MCLPLFPSPEPSVFWLNPGFGQKAPETKARGAYHERGVGSRTRDTRRKRRILRGSKWITPQTGVYPEPPSLRKSSALSEGLFPLQGYGEVNGWYPGYHSYMSRQAARLMRRADFVPSSTFKVEEEECGQDLQVLSSQRSGNSFTSQKQDISALHPAYPDPGYSISPDCTSGKSSPSSS